MIRLLPQRLKHVNSATKGCTAQKLGHQKVPVLCVRKVFFRRRKEAQVVLFVFKADLPTFPTPLPVRCVTGESTLLKLEEQRVPLHRPVFTSVAHRMTSSVRNVLPVASSVALLSFSFVSVILVPDVRSKHGPKEDALEQNHVPQVSLVIHRQLEDVSLVQKEKQVAKAMLFAVLVELVLLPKIVVMRVLSALVAHKDMSAN